MKDFEQFEQVGDLQLWILRESDTHWVLMAAMGYTYRIGSCPKTEPKKYAWFQGPAWCYPRALLALAIAEGLRYDSEHSPVGWIKEVGGKRERRACQGLYPRPNNAHTGFDPDCEYCAGQ